MSVTIETPKVAPPEPTPKESAIIVGVILLILGGTFTAGWFTHRNNAAFEKQVKEETLATGPAVPVPPGPVFAAQPVAAQPIKPKKPGFWDVWEKLREEHAELAKQLTYEEETYLCTLAAERELDINAALAMMRTNQFSVYYAVPQVIADDRVPEPNPKLFGNAKNKFKPRAYQIPRATGLPPGPNPATLPPGPNPQLPLPLIPPPPGGLGVTPAPPGGPGGAWPTPTGPGGR